MSGFEQYCAPKSTVEVKEVSGVWSHALPLTLVARGRDLPPVAPPAAGNDHGSLVRDRRRLPAGDPPALVAHQARLHRRRVCDRHGVVCPPGSAVRTRVECVTRAGAVDGDCLGSTAPGAGLPSPRAACAPSDATSLAHGAAPGHAPRLVARSAYPPPEIAGLSPRSTG